MRGSMCYDIKVTSWINIRTLVSITEKAIGITHEVNRA
jgi:hypothetical protein